MIDVSSLEDFARRCEAACKELKPHAGKTLDEIGEEFLDIVQEEITKAGNLDTREMIESFAKGSGYNVYDLDMGALTLTVGTRVGYSEYVNGGHPQQSGRFVPGIWKGEHFIYTPGAKTGMVLKASKVEGSHFFDKSIDALNRMLPQMTRSSFEQFFKRYFP